MLHNIKELYGRRLAATDGEVGQIKDIYFDDQAWAIRYVVVDTGSWLSGRQVLLAPHAFGNLGSDDDALQVDLTRRQIGHSPPIDSHRPVSRQYEMEYFRYYGWPVYWIGDGFGGLGGFPGAIPVPSSDSDRHHGHNQRDDVHLRSTRAVTGYHLQTTDGSIGHVRDFVLDDQNWVLCELIVETGHWYSGKRILVSTNAVSRIGYEQSTVYLNLTQADVQRTMEGSVARAGAEAR